MTLKNDKMIKLYKTSLAISLAVTIVGAMLKIQHWPGGRLLISIGLLISLIYIVIALVEIYKANKSLTEKLLWLVGFLMLSWIVGLIYYYSELKPKQR